MVNFINAFFLYATFNYVLLQITFWKLIQFISER